MLVTVLGGGIVGATTAWFVHRAGHDVCVVDVDSAACCNAPACLGSVAADAAVAEQADPVACANTLRWLLRACPELMSRLRHDPVRWNWAVGLFGGCEPTLAPRTIERVLALGWMSRRLVRDVEAELGLPDHARTGSVLRIYSDASRFDVACLNAARMRGSGNDVAILSAADCLVRVPALADSRVRLAGGCATAVGEARGESRLLRALDLRLAADGVRFQGPLRFTSLHREGERVVAACARDAAGQARTLLSDAWVICDDLLGSRFAYELGIDFHLRETTGQCISFADEALGSTLGASVIDDDRRLTIARSCDRLRIAGAAESNGGDRRVNAVRCEGIAARACQLFPSLSRGDGPRYECDRRFVSSGQAPRIGASRLANLHLNIGHGRWRSTLAFGAGSMVADLVDRRGAIMETCFGR